MERTIKTNAKSLCLSEEVLLNAVDFLRRKIVEGDLTVGEYESLSRLFGEGLNLMGTADDFAEFFVRNRPCGQGERGEREGGEEEFLHAWISGVVLG